MFFAQLNQTPPIPWSTTGTFMLGLIGVLSVVLLALFVWNQGKKAFGRVPPFHEELDKREKAMRRQIYAVESTLRREAKQLHEDSVRRINLLEQQYIEMQTDRERKWTALTKDINEVRQTLAFIRGRFEKETT